MKRLIKPILSFLLALTVLVPSFTGLGGVQKAHAVTDNAPQRNERLIYAAPGTLPDGSLKSTVTVQDYGTAARDHIENDDWDWDTMASRYQVIERNGDPAMHLWPVGGFASSLEQWHWAADITGAQGVMMFLDFTNLVDSTGLYLGVRIDTSPDGRQGNVSLLDTTYLAPNVDCAYYDFITGEWVTVTSNADCRVPLPDGFAGYVYLPSAAFPAINNNGVFGSVYFQMYHLDFTVGTVGQNVTPIIIDTLEIVKSAGAHTHDYRTAATVAPTCTEQGMTVLQCGCGQVKWQDVQAPTDHDPGTAHKVSQGVTGALCADCGELVLAAGEATEQWEEAVNVTYCYADERLADRNVTYAYPKGYTLSVDDIPYIWQIVEDYDIDQFFRWTTDDKNIDGCDPLGMTATEDVTLYAHYNTCAYNDQKYRAMMSDVSFNGGPYNTAKHEGKMIFIGASNFSLWGGMEQWYQAQGVPVLNNSIAGCTNYNVEEFLDELILMYKPAIVVSGITFNDFNYHAMTEKLVM